MRVSALITGIPALVLAISVVTACRREPQAPPPAGGDTTVAMRTVAVPVDGMICQVCAGTVKSTLKKFDGVRDAEISLEKRHAVIQYDERKVSLEALTRAIKDAGYTPGVPSPIQSQ
jgi:mercuric transport protein